jgi:hypothetical protein
MHHSRFLSVFAFASVAILATPAYVTSQTTTDKLEREAKSAARDVKAEVTDSWLTAKTKIALYSDERVKGRQISVETVHRTVRLRGKVDSDEARTAATSIAEGIEHVAAVKNDLEVVAIEDRKATDVSDKDITVRSKPASPRPPSSPRSTSEPMAGSSPSPGLHRASGPAPVPPSWPVACPASARSGTS